MWHLKEIRTNVSYLRAVLQHISHPKMVLRIHIINPTEYFSICNKINSPLRSAAAAGRLVPGAVLYYP